MSTIPFDSLGQILYVLLINNLAYSSMLVKHRLLFLFFSDFVIVVLFKFVVMERKMQWETDMVKP